MVTDDHRLAFLRNELARMRRHSEAHAESCRHRGNRLAVAQEAGHATALADAADLLDVFGCTVVEVYTLAQRYCSQGYAQDATPQTVGEWEGWRAVRGLFDEFSVLLPDHLAWEG